MKNFILHFILLSFIPSERRVHLQLSTRPFFQTTPQERWYHLSDRAIAEPARRQMKQISLHSFTQERTRRALSCIFTGGSFPAHVLTPKVHSLATAPFSLSPCLKQETSSLAVTDGLRYYKSLLTPSLRELGASRRASVSEQSAWHLGSDTSTL